MKRRSVHQLLTFGGCCQVQRGNVSQRALEVKEKLRMLNPAEGLGLIGWLLNRMENNIAPQHLDKVRIMGSVSCCVMARE